MIFTFFKETLSFVVKFQLRGKKVLKSTFQNMGEKWIRKQKKLKSRSSDYKLNFQKQKIKWLSNEPKLLIESP